MTISARPLLDHLACVNPECISYGMTLQSNLTVRKIYGADQIRYLRCSHCGEEFSERKNTALWNCKIPEARAISVAEHLSEGNSLKSTSRLTRTTVGTVRRIALKSGRHGKQFHQEQAQSLACKTLEMDERHGYVEDKTQQMWDAVTLDPASKFIVQLEVGERNEALMLNLMRHSVERLSNPQDILLMTDGAVTYAQKFPEVFGEAYIPPVKGQLDAFLRCNIAYPAPSLTFRSSNIVRERNLSR
jgi:IS1 family transposase/transposase-like protein